MTTKYLELSREETPDYEKTVSIVVDKEGVFEEVYTYKSLNSYDELTLDELIYDATVKHDYILEKVTNGVVILKNSKKYKNELLLYPKTNEFEIMEYNKMEKK